MSNTAEIFHIFQSIYIKRRNIIKSNIDKNVIRAELLPALSYIESREGCTQKSIAEELAVTPSAVAQTAKKLEAAGLIKRFENSECRREKKLTVTEKGRAAVKRAKAEFDALDQIAVENLSAEEIDCLETILRKINENIADTNRLADKMKPWD